MSSAAVIIGAAVVGAAGMVISGSEAASATRDASNAAIQQQQSALAQQKEMAAPYTGLGQQAMGAYENLLGIGKDGKVDPALAQQTLRNMPGYQFAQQQGSQNTLASAGAMGMGLSGNTLTALDKFNTGLADQTYQQELQNLLQPVQIGQAASAGQSANIGNAANNMSNIMTNQGTNQANIAMGVGSGITGSIGNAANSYMTMNTLAGLRSPATTPMMSLDPSVGAAATMPLGIG